MAFTSSTAELFSRYRYRDDNNCVEYDDMEIVSDTSASASECDTEPDDYSYNYNEESQTQSHTVDDDNISESRKKDINSYNKPVLHLKELCEDGSYDWSLFVRYEQDDNYIVYGIRKSYSADARRSKYNPIRVKFLGREPLLAFFRHAFCSISSKLNVTMYNMSFNDDTYEGTYQHYASRMLLSKYDELFGYDGLDINMNTLNDYLTFLRYAWN